MLSRLKALVIKELQIVLRNPQSRNLIIGPVLLQLAVFPFAATLEVKNASLAVLNRDSGPASIEILQRLAHSEAFPHLTMLHSPEEMDAQISDRRSLVVLQFPEDFSRNLSAGKDASFQVIVDGRRSNSGQIALSYIQSIAHDYTSELNEQAGHVVLSRLDVRNLYNPNLDYKWFILPSLIAIITTLSVMFFTSLAVAREKEQGTFEQLLVTPLDTMMILVGKAVPAMIVALIQATIIFLAAVLVYDVPFSGSVTLLYVGMFFYSTALIGFGSLIAAVSSTQQQAFLGVFGFMMPAIVLSGYVTPVENMPVALQWLSWMSPLRHFIIMVKGIFLKDFTLPMFWEHLWPMLVIAALMLSVSFVIFRRSIR